MWQRAMNDFERRYSEVCAGLDADQRRQLRSVGPSEGGRTMIAGRSMINLSSNDYLGLSQHPLLLERASEWPERSKWLLERALDPPVHSK